MLSYVAHPQDNDTFKAQGHTQEVRAMLANFGHLPSQRWQVQRKQEAQVLDPPVGYGFVGVVFAAKNHHILQSRILIYFKDKDNSRPKGHNIA